MALTSPVKQAVRRIARRTVRVRQTPAWPLVRPVARLAAKAVDPARLLGVRPWVLIRADGLPRPGLGAVCRPRDFEDALLDTAGAGPAAWAARRQVWALRRRLVGLGLADRALADLYELVKGGAGPLPGRLAAWTLALWHAELPGGADEALRLLRAAVADDPRLAGMSQPTVVEAELLRQLGDTAAAQRVVESALARGPGAGADVWLAAANLASSPEGRLPLLNNALAMLGASPVGLAAGPGLPAFARLAATPPLRRVRRYPLPGDAPLVSVLIVARDAGPALGPAIESVLAQTWTKLEVLVVDSGSTDRTPAVIADYARRDGRIRALTADPAQGGYAARNLALRHATGELVTCHDPDSWCHPERIERQVLHLAEHPAVVASTVPSASIDADLGFQVDGTGRHISHSLSSLLFRREPVLAAAGYWDCVVAGADAEFRRRVKQAFGPRAVTDLPAAPPVLRQAGTAPCPDDVMAWRDQTGPDREYAAAYRAHHRTAKSLRYPYPQPARPFPAPTPVLPPRQGKGRKRRHFDIVLAADFGSASGALAGVAEEIRALRRAKLRTGLLPMFRYDGPARDPRPAIRRLVDGESVRIVTAGERVSSDLLVIRQPAVLDERHHHLPEIETHRLWVVLDAPPRDGHDLARRARHARDMFGADPVWVPADATVRAAGSEAPAQVRLAGRSWVDVTGERADHIERIVDLHPVRFHQLVARPVMPDWLERHKGIPERDREELLRVEHKAVGRRLAQRLGLAVPEVYAEGLPLREAVELATRPAVPATLVVKPEQSVNSWCVRQLVRDGSGRFLDILRDTRYESGRLCELLAEEMREREIADSWVVEELMLPAHGGQEPIDDLKFYAFHGEIALILQKQNILDAAGDRDARYAWYDSAWRTVDVGKYHHKLGRDITPPSAEERAELLRVAVEASRQIPYPFIRVDLYHTNRGVVFGEFTPFPGGADKFDMPVSWRLATAWFDSEARLEASYPRTEGR